MEIIRAKIKAIAVVFLYLLLVFPLSVIAATGTEYLASQTQLDGSYSNPVDVATPFQSTSETLRTFHVLGETVQPGIPNALQFINAEGFHTTEILSRKIIANHQVGNDVSLFITELLAMQNIDGGYGDLAGYDSTALDTVFALDAFATVEGIAGDVIANAIGFLQTQQNSDGSFRISYQNQSSVYSTALVLKTLQAYLFNFNISANINSAKDFLIQAQDSSGGWSSDWETALSLIALVPVTTDTNLYFDAVTVLQSAMQLNGSWADDVYATALATHALFLVENIEKPVDPTTGIFSGKVVDFDTGLPLANVQVSISGLPDLNTKTVQDGTFTIDNIPPDSQVVSYVLAGYNGATQTVTSQSGFVQSLGVVKLLALSTVGTVSGVITQADNGLPVAGATVQINGSITQSVVTDSRGFYRVAHQPEQVVLTVAAAGFDIISGLGTVIGGSTLIFSPALYTINSTPTDSAVSISGVVIDDATNLPLNGVLIDVIGLADSGATGTNGKFNLSGLLAGELIIDVSMPGYRTVRLTVVAPDSSTNYLGEIRLTLSSNLVSTIITGQVLDKGTGNAIPNANIAIDITGLGTKTLGDGSYQIENVTTTQFIVTASAVGYISVDFSVRLSEHGTVNVDFSLQNAGTSDLQISNISTAQPSYPALTNVDVDLQLHNTGTTDKTVRLYVKVFNSNSQLIDDYPAQQIPQNVDPSIALITVAAGGVIPSSAQWNTARYAPDTYQIIVQAIQVENNQIVAERGIDIEILSTSRIGGLAEFDPPIAQLAANAPVSITSSMSNMGNQIIQTSTVTATVSLKVKGPDAKADQFRLDSKFIENLNGPRGMDIDAAGNLYIANCGDNNIVKVSPDRTKTIVLDDLMCPVDVDLDAFGNLYAVNANNSYVKLDVDGVKTTVTTDLSAQEAIEVLLDGRVLVARTNELYEIALDGMITKVASGGLADPQGIALNSQGAIFIANKAENSIAKYDNGTLSIFKTGINQPTGIAIDELDNLYVTGFASNSLFKITPDGTQSTIATGLSGPMDVKISPDGNFIVSNNGSNEIVSITPSGVVTTLIHASIYRPNAAVYDSFGNLFIANNGSSNVIKYSPDGAISTIGTTSIPQAITITDSGDIFLVENYSNISHISPDGTRSILVSNLNNVSDVIATPQNDSLVISVQNKNSDLLKSDYSGNISTFITPQFSSPASMTTSADHSVIYILNNTGVITRINNLGEVILITTDLQNTIGIDRENDSSFIVTEHNNRTVKRVDLNGNTQHIATLSFNPGAVTVAQNGDIFVAEWSGNNVYKVDSGGVVTLYATFPQSLNYGLLVDSNGIMWVSHTASNKVTRLAVDGTQTVFTVTGAPNGIVSDGSGGVLIGGLSNIKHIDGTGIVTDYIANTNVPKGNQSIKGLAVDNNNKLWAVASTGYLVRFNADKSLDKEYFTLQSAKNIAFAGNAIVVVNGSNTVIKMDAPNKLPEILVHGSFTKLVGETAQSVLLANSTTVYRLELTTGSLTTFASSLSGIAGLAVSNSGAVAVGESSLNKLSIFAQDGSLDNSFYGLVKPIGIEIDVNGDVFIANSFPRGVMRIDVNGDLSLFSNPNISPKYLALDTDGGLLLSRVNEILKLSSTGSIISRFGTNSSTGVLRGVNGELVYASNLLGALLSIENNISTVIASGLSKVKDIETDSAGNIYVADNGVGAVVKVNADYSLGIFASDFNQINKLHFAPDDTLFASNIYSNIETIDPSGNRNKIPLSSIFNKSISGIAVSSDHTIFGSYSALSTHNVFSFTTQSPAENDTLPGDVIYSATTTLAGLGLSGDSVDLDFGSWTPTISGDYEVTVHIDSGMVDNKLSNTIHVGAVANGSIFVENDRVLPGDNIVTTHLSITGIDSENISRIDSAGTRLAVSSGVNGRGITADTQGNLYATSANKIVRYTTSGVLSDYLTGLSIKNIGIVSDANDNLYYVSSNNVDIMKVASNGALSKIATHTNSITAFNINYNDELFIVDQKNNLSQVYGDGTIRNTQSDGMISPWALAIDRYDNKYIANSTVSDTGHVIIRIPESGDSSYYFDRAYFEREGVNITADCSNNLLFAPISLMPERPVPIEEDAIYQLNGNSGEVRKILDGRSTDPDLWDIDVLSYDRFGNQLLIWSDVAGGKIFSLPVVCGGIDVTAHIITSANVDLNSATPSPSSVVDLGDGTLEYIWSLTDINLDAFNIQLNLLASGMAEGEIRSIAKEAFLEFSNSFATGENVRVAIDIPQILAITNVSITPQLDALQYGPNSPVAISVDVLNANDMPFTGSMTASIQDMAGNTVIDLTTVQISALVPFTPQTYTQLWNTGTIFSGNYQFFVTLFDESGVEIKQASTSFSILSSDPATPGDVIQTAVYTNKQTYQAWDSVQISGRLQNVSQNAIQSGANLEVTLRAPGGSILYFDTASVGEMIPGSLIDLPFLYSVSDAVSGQYTIVFVAKDLNGQVLNSSNTTFLIDRQDIQSLTGTATILSRQIVAGDSQACNTALINNSSFDIAGANVTHLIMNIDTSKVISTSSETLNLLAGSAQTKVLPVSSNGLAAGGYSCILQATVSGTTQTIAFAGFTVEANQNQVPVANAGIDQSVHIGKLVTLDGSASSDIDGDTLSYQWRVIAAPAGSASVLSDPTAVNPGIGIDKHGSYTIQLIVNDGIEDSIADTVVLTVLNRAPVANAGNDQIVHIHDIVALNGTQSADADGDVLTYEWRIVSAPVGSVPVLSNTNAAQPDINIDSHGEYLLELIVNDGLVDSAPDTVKLTVENRIPIADAGLDQSVYINDVIMLDASNSQDTDNDPMTYTWSILNAPAGSNATLSDPTAPQPTLQVDSHGSYTLQVIVNDGIDNSLPDTVVLNVLNRIPVANAGPDQGIDGSIEAIYSTVILDGSASTDGDGDAMSYLWTIAEKPVGSTTSLVNPGSVAPFFVPDLVGQYVVELIVNDGFDNSTPDTATISVVEPKPVITGDMQGQGKGRLLVLMDREEDIESYSDEPSFLEQHYNLEAILMRADWSYTIVTNIDVFTLEMRTGEYSAYAILSEKQLLEERLQRELREAVYRGDGLLVAGAHDNRMEKLEAALGIKHEGKHNEVTGLDVLMSDIHELGDQVDLALQQKPLRFIIEGAIPVASYQFSTPAGAPLDSALTVYDYGLGTSVFSGLDLLAQATAAGQGSLFETLLANALGVVHPDSLKSLTGGVIPITLELIDERVSTSGRVMISLPEGTYIVDSTVSLSSTGIGAIWEYDILDGETLSMTFWLRLPDQSGPVTIQAVVQSGELYDYLDQTTLNLEMAVEASPSITGVVDEARSLVSQFPAEEAFIYALENIEHADKELVKGSPEKALKELIKATDKLLVTSLLEGGQLRLMIDQLIRSIEQSL